MLYILKPSLTSLKWQCSNACRQC